MFTWILIHAKKKTLRNKSDRASDFKNDFEYDCFASKLSL